uniref:Sodium channel, voltage-gated, type I, beta b n=1 Tax=Cyprinus carpio TaxID=7962 RepID=A0A8C1RE39_CYPCA
LTHVDGACAEVDSDTEAVAGQLFKLGCISCKMRGEVEATATVDWMFRARGEADFVHVSIKRDTQPPQNEMLSYEHYEFSTIASKEVHLTVVGKGTRTADLCVPVTVISGERCINENAVCMYFPSGDACFVCFRAEYLAIASESKDNCAGVQVAE